MPIDYSSIGDRVVKFVSRVLCNFSAALIELKKKKKEINFFAFIEISLHIKVDYVVKFSVEILVSHH